MLKPPLLSQLESTVNKFLNEELLKESIPNCILSDRKSDFTLNWKASARYHKWVPFLMKTASTEEMIVHLKERCLQYSSLLPFKDNKTFLEFCFLLRTKNSTEVWHHKTFNMLKFAMVLDQSYLGLMLLDSNQEARDLAKILIDHKELLWIT